MFANSLIVEQLEYSGYLRVFQMQGLPGRPLTIAFADELDEPHDCPFHFLDGHYKDIFEKGFAECKALKLPESNFAIANGEYRFRTSWKGIFDLLPGSLVLFSNVVNQNWKHAIPQDTTATGERISLTYREF
jgi:hypothetical protein